MTKNVYIYARFCVSVKSYLQCISKFSGFVFRVFIFQRKERKGK